METLEIGGSYECVITHVNTPSNFFIQLSSSMERTGNLMNNLDNYYRNGFLDDNESNIEYVFLLFFLTSFCFNFCCMSEIYIVRLYE